MATYKLPQGTVKIPSILSANTQTLNIRDKGSGAVNSSLSTGSDFITPLQNKGANVFDNDVYNDAAKRTEAMQPTLLETLSANVLSFNTVGAAYFQNVYNNSQDDYKYDKDFNYSVGAFAAEQGLTEWQVEQMRDTALSESHRNYLRNKFIETSKRDTAASAWGWGVSLLGGAVGLLTDPLAFAQLRAVNQAHRGYALNRAQRTGAVVNPVTLVQSTRGATATGYAVEGAVSGGLYSLGLDLVGEYQTVEDYGLNILAGAGLSGMVGAFRSPTKATAVDEPVTSVPAYSEQTLADVPDAQVKNVYDGDFTVPLPKPRVRVDGKTGKPKVRVNAVIDDPVPLNEVTNSVTKFNTVIEGTTDASVVTQKDVSNFVNHSVESVRDTMYDDLIAKKTVLSEQVNELRRALDATKNKSAHVQRAALARLRNAEAQLSAHTKLMDDYVTTELAPKLKVDSDLVERVMRDPDYLAEAHEISIGRAQAAYEAAYAARMVEAVKQAGGADADDLLQKLRELEAQDVREALAPMSQGSRNFPEHLTYPVDGNVVDGQYTPILDDSVEQVDVQSSTPEPLRITYVPQEPTVTRVPRNQKTTTTEEVIYLSDERSAIELMGVRIKDLDTRSNESIDDIVNSINKSIDDARVRNALMNDPVLAQAVKSGLLKVVRNLASEGAVSVKRGKAVAVSVSAKLTDVLAQFVGHHELMHVNIAAYFKTVPEYLKFIETAKSVPIINKMVTSQHFKVNGYSQLYARNSTKELADARAIEEAIVDLWAYSQNPAKFTEVMINRYGFVPDIKPRYLQRLVDNLRNWLSKIMPKVFTKRTNVGSFMAELRKVADARDAYELARMLDRRSITVSGIKDGKVLSKGSRLTPEQRQQARQAIRTAAEKKRRRNIGRKWDLDQATYEHSLANAYRIAEDKLNGVSIDMPTIVNVYAKGAPQIASAAVVLAQEANPIARAFVVDALETTADIKGRGNTIAMTKHLKENLYMSTAIPQINTLFKAWNRRQGISFPKRMIDQHFFHKQREAFEKLVHQEIEWRKSIKDGVADAQLKPPAAAEVIDAANAIERGMDIMRKDQIGFKVEGWQALPDSSVGYMSRQINAKWWAGASKAHKDAFLDFISEDLVRAWGTEYAVVAKSIAKTYVQRYIHGQYGQVSMSLVPAKDKVLLEQLLSELNFLSIETKSALTRKLNNYGSKYTKQRLPLDLTRVITASDGSKFKVIDAFNGHVSALYTSYARRVSGEVGLASKGYQGESVMYMLAQFMRDAPDGLALSDAGEKAYNQVVAELLGRPFGDANVVLDTLRLAAQANLLGINVFAQVVDFYNIGVATGVDTMMSSVFPQMRNLLNDVRNGTANDPILKDLEEHIGVLGHHYNILMPNFDATTSNVFSGELNTLQRLITGLGNINSKLTGYNALHTVQTRGAARAILSSIFTALRTAKVNGNTIDLAIPVYRRELWKDMGFTDDVLIKLHKELPQVAKYDASGRLTDLNLNNASSMDVVDDLSQRVMRGVGQTVQREFVGEKSYWSHFAVGKLVTQFRSMAITAMEKQVWRLNATVGTAKFSMMVLGAATFAIPIHLAKVQLLSLEYEAGEERQAFLDAQTSKMMLTRAIMQYCINTGLASDMLDALMFATGSVLDNNELVGDSEFAKGVQDFREASGKAGIVGLVPSIGYADRLITSIGKLAADGDVGAAIRALPAGRIHFTRPVTAAMSRYAQEDEE